MADPYFFDSSGLVKWYAYEAGSDWVLTITGPQAGNHILIAEITKVEVVNALMRKERTGEMTRAEADLSVDRFLLHLRDQYHIVELRSSALNEAIRLVRGHVLRAYDAVQLAVALEVNRAASPPGASLLRFVSADDQLNIAALAEGLNIENPGK